MPTIEQNLQRLQQARTAIANSIVAKGGTVPMGDGLEEFAADISTIAPYEMTGKLPLTFKSDGESLRDYTVYGKNVRTANLIDDKIKLFSSNSIYIGTDSASGISCVLPAGTYTFSVTTKTGVNTNLYIVEADNPQTYIDGFPVYGVKDKTFTILQEKSVKIYVYDINASGSDFIQNAMLNAGSTALPYEPYYDGIGERTANLVAPRSVITEQYGIIVTPQNDGSVILNGTKTGEYNNAVLVTSSFAVQSNTDYIISIGNYDTTIINDYGLQGFGSRKQINHNAQYVSDGIQIYINTGVVLNNVRIYPQINSGSTALPYEPYGYKIPVEYTGMSANIWDEEWEVGGMIANSINSKNYISVMPNCTYFFSYTGDVSNVSFYVRFFDADNQPCAGYESTNGVYIDRTYPQTTPSNAHYLKFRASAQYGTTYNHDISINYPATVTQYVPYGPEQKTLNLYTPSKLYEGDTLTYAQTGVDIPTVDGVNVIDTTLDTKFEMYIQYGGNEYNTLLGVEVDFVNKTFKRLAAAEGLTAGTDFNRFPTFGGRRRCNVADDGTINAFYGDSGYAEDGSNGQVMVYQPKFYYKVVPLTLEAQEGTNNGYHLRKAQYYVSSTKNSGFKVHPAFVRDGKEVDYVCLSAYEGCIFDTSGDTYITDDSQIADFTADKFSSIAGVKPASGLSQNLTRANVRNLAHNRGTGWEQAYAATISASQLLMLVEYASFNMQSAIDNGVVSKTDDGSTNMAEYTGGTISLGNASGQATNQGGFNLVSYRGEENFWGNIWGWVDGLNCENPNPFNDGAHGTIYVADHGFADNTGAAPYENTGIYPCKAVGAYISAFGYNEKFDWLFIPTEVSGNSSLPVGDMLWNANTGWRVVVLGGSWDSGSKAGAFGLNLDIASSAHYRNAVGRLVYFPTGNASQNRAVSLTRSAAPVELTEEPEELTER